MNNPLDENSKQTSNNHESKEIILRGGHSELSSFISNLLGKPQTIEKVFKLAYKLDREDVTNTYQLVNQRINQQNEASLVQFNVKIIYDDDSSVLLNSMDDFLVYKEVRPLTSVAVILSWTYLITFKNKNTLEKQEIDLAFRSNISSDSSIFEDGIDISREKRYYPSSSINLRVCHTDRTWATDIESLLSGHIKTLKIDEKRLKAFVRKRSGTISLAVFTLLFFGALFVCNSTTNKIIDSSLDKLSEITNKYNESNLLEAKIDLLTSVLVKGTWPRHITNSIIYISISFVVSFALAIWVAYKASSKRHSFVLLSKAAKEYRDKVIKKSNRDWYMFFVSVICSILTGVVSNTLFALYFSGKI